MIKIIWFKNRFRHENYSSWCIYFITCWNHQNFKSQILQYITTHHKVVCLKSQKIFKTTAQRHFCCTLFQQYQFTKESFFQYDPAPPPNLYRHSEFYCLKMCLLLFLNKYAVLQNSFSGINKLIFHISE